MSKRVEIEVVSHQSPEQKDEQEFQSARVDLSRLCEKLNLRWFSYQEEIPGQRGVPPEDRAKRTVFFIHERGTETGVKFMRKREMADQVVLFYVARLVWRDEVFVQWAGRRGLHILTTMSEADRKEVQRQKAALEAMKEASAAGEMVNVEAGLAPLQSVL